jgi:hypothetical protein
MLVELAKYLFTPLYEFAYFDEKQTFVHCWKTINKMSSEYGYAWYYKRPSPSKEYEVWWFRRCTVLATKLYILAHRLKFFTISIYPHLYKYILSLICFAIIDCSAISHRRWSPEMWDAVRSSFRAKHIYTRVCLSMIWWDNVSDVIIASH